MFSSSMKPTASPSPPRIPWRLYLLLWEVRKFALRLLVNLRHRRPFWSIANLCTLHRMIDPRRLPADAIPVVINNFNRADSLRTLVDWILTLEGNPAVIILDNGSTYPPVKAYYRSLRALPQVQVVRLGFNARLYGIADAVQELTAFPRYVVTDPDLVPYPQTPRNILTHMKAMLDRYPQFTHVGASLEIRDIPATYPLREQVIAWESRYWPPAATPVGLDGYEAWVDTTFGMYRQGADVTQIAPAMRLARPFTLQHVDWYLDPDHLTDEQRFYRRVSLPVASWTHKLRLASPTNTPS